MSLRERLETEAPDSPGMAFLVKFFESVTFVTERVREMQPSPEPELRD